MGQCLSTPSPKGAAAPQPEFTPIAQQPEAKAPLVASGSGTDAVVSPFSAAASPEIVAVQPGPAAPQESVAPQLSTPAGSTTAVANGDHSSNRPVTPPVGNSASPFMAPAGPNNGLSQAPSSLPGRGSSDAIMGRPLPDLSSVNSNDASKLQPSGFQIMNPQQLASEVQQLSWIGHGGYGAVYKGVWQGANVAVKFTVTDYLDMQGASAHEAALSKLLSHPNVVQTYASRVALLDEDFLRRMFDDGNFPSRELPQDSFRSGEGFGSPYGVNATMKFKDALTHIGARPGHYMTQMIMEYCDRGSLHQAIAKGLFKTSTKWNNKIALRALLRTAREIAQGMSHLHACRVVHGDLKPGNVLLMSSRADRRGFTAKVSDFGLSTYCMASHISVTRWSTVSYMAPEAFEGHLTMGSDTYSFGVLIWEMYTGLQPYAGMQAAHIVMGVQAGTLRLEWPPDCEPRIIELVESCIQRDPTKRPTFLQLINTLTQLEAQVRVETRQASETPSGSATSVPSASSPAQSHPQQQLPQ